MRLGSLLRTALAFLLAAGAARGDPRHVWQTIDTPHFEVHYHQGEAALAARVARIAELAHRKLAPLLDHEPVERCQILLQDDTDFANGSATPLLFNAIHAFAPPPDPRSTLNDFDDYLWELIGHEYTHILHLDTVRGLPQMVNQIFGKLWIPNGGQPAWFVEGLAVYEESDSSGAGRVRSSQEEMTVRTELLERRFPTIDQLSNLPLDWPRGNSWYTIGGRFLDWIGEHYGAGALRDLSHDFGGRAIPLGLNLSAESVLGKSYLTLFEEFREDALNQARSTAAQVRAEGETKLEPLTRLGELTRSPRWSRDGSRLYYASAGPDRLPELRELVLPPCCALGSKLAVPVREGDRRLTETYGDDTLAVRPDGSLVFSRPQVYQEFETLEDLYSFDPQSGDQARVTRGLRASEPDAAPDGALVFVQRKPGGRTAIALLEAGLSEPRTLFEDPLQGPVGSPRFSPSGNLVAFTHHRAGSWDVRVIGRDGSGLFDVTGDRAIDRDPSWSPDGRYLLFSSDRTGIYDLYAFRLEDRHLLRVTRVVGGAFEPAVSPDGTQLALVSYSARGYDLSRLPFDPSTFTEVTSPSLAERVRPKVTELPPEEIFPVRDYQPLETLRPHYWLPYAGADASGTTVGALTSGSDIAGRHEYAGSAWFGLDSRLPSWDLSYTNHTLWPDITLAASGDLVVPAGLPDNTERQIAGSLFASVPFSTFERAFSLGAGYQLNRLTARADPFHRAAPDGTIAALLLQLAYSDAKRFVRSVSSEQGQRFSVSFRVADRALASDFSFRQLSAAYSRYLALPWSFRGRPLHHALALRLSGGVSRGDLSQRHLFSLGGFDIGDPIRSVVNPQSAPVRVLRGYRSGSFGGEAYALGSLEYRFPLLQIEAGAWTLPIYLRRLHAAVFTDVGDAFTPSQKDFHLHAGAGAELRAEVILGWYLPTDVRAGCAHGLETSPNSIWDCYAALGGIF